MTKKIIAAISPLLALSGFWFYSSTRRAVMPIDEKPTVPAPQAVATHAEPPRAASTNAGREPVITDIAPAVLLARKYYDPKTDSATRIRAYVELMFGDILASFGLSGATLQKVEDLIAERYLSATDAQNIIDESHREHGGVTTGGESKQLRENIENSIDDEIRQTVDAQAASKIAQMLKASMYFTQVKSQYAQQFAASGAPLTPTQMFSLASVLSETLGSGSPTSVMSRDIPVDPATGLTDLDKTVLAKAGSVLTSTQLEVLRHVLAVRTARVSVQR